jgi:UPF0755 protein
MESLRARLRTLAPRLAIAAVILLPIAGMGYSSFFGPVSPDMRVREFIIEPESDTASVASDLREQGFVRSTLAARIAIAQASLGRPLRPGAYDLRKDMDVWKVGETLVGVPRMVFVQFPVSVRKEQIGIILERELGWGEEQRQAWAAATSGNEDIMEGVYYPDLYLIPTDQEPAQIAARMRGRFTDLFEPYARRAEAKGLDWHDVLTLASIIDREAALNDKHLVSGILWNRLDAGMRLQADATLQYIRGASGAWWPQPKSEDKFLDSPFNTYKYAGLPPHPINNPTFASIEAALDPQRTDCIYYLHSPGGQIHCATNYAQHERNIDRYLR